MDKDVALEHLRSLHVPPADSAAIERIMEHARAKPKRQWAPFAAIRMLKAWIYVPFMRYIIMASVVGFFILVGTYGEYYQDPTAPQQVASAENEDPMSMDEMLFDVEFPEEQWADNFLFATAGYSY